MASRILVSLLMFASAFAYPNNNQARSQHNSGESSPSFSRTPLIPRSYQSPAWVPSGQRLHPALSQEVTNGKSVLGTLDAPRLPKYLPGGPSAKDRRNDRRGVPPSNFGIGDVPNTGVTRYYTLVVTEQNIAPDGVTRSGMVVNGSYPGPTLSANWGDYFEVTVINQLATEGLSIHWHGLLQHETPFYDGVPGTQQCPLVPGQTFTYRFRADLYGTTFYHSHYSAQYTGGIYGPLIIYGPADNAHYDEDLGPIIVNDWYHAPYFTTLEQAMAPISANELPPASNNNLINGKMNYPCANATGLQCTPNAGISKFQFESGKSYRLRLINGGAEGMQKFSIDGHTLTVIANDFVPIKPYQTDVVTLGIGQRTDVVVKATGSANDAVWMRSNLGLSGLQYPNGCTNNDGVSPEAVAAVYYQKADTSAQPNSTSSVTSDQIQTCENDPLTSTVPFYSLSPVPDPTMTETINITYQSNGTHDLFYMNNSTFRADYNNPVLLDAKAGQTTFSPELNVISTGNNTSLRLILYNWNIAGAHPMHMHGHNYWVLAMGQGIWDGTIQSGSGASNPQRRDVQLLPKAIINSDFQVLSPGYIVLQIDLNNPGAWPLHCHIAWHVSAGLYVTILEQPGQITGLHIPQNVKQTCKDWAQWTGKDVPDQIDSGL